MLSALCPNRHSIPIREMRITGASAFFVQKYINLPSRRLWVGIKKGGEINMIKKIASAAIGAGLVLATVLPAMAANTCGNYTTGPTSNNYCNRLLDKFKDVRVNNSGTVNHGAFIFANTGNNTSDNNTNASTNAVDTGDADLLDSSSVADLNTSNTDVDQSDPAVDEQGTNNVTGPNSNNTVTFNTTKNLTVNVSNDGTVDHQVEIMANSGYNSASHNTNTGSVKTGKASISVLIGSFLNSITLKLKQ